MFISVVMSAPLLLASVIIAVSSHVQIRPHMILERVLHLIINTPLIYYFILGELVSIVDRINDAGWSSEATAANAKTSCGHR